MYLENSLVAYIKILPLLEIYPIKIEAPVSVCTKMSSATFVAVIEDWNRIWVPFSRECLNKSTPQDMMSH